MQRQSDFTGASRELMSVCRVSGDLYESLRPLRFVPARRKGEGP